MKRKKVIVALETEHFDEAYNLAEGFYVADIALIFQIAVAALLDSPMLSEERRYAKEVLAAMDELGKKHVQIVPWASGPLIEGEEH